MGFTFQDFQNFIGENSSIEKKKVIFETMDMNSPLVEEFIKKEAELSGKSEEEIRETFKLKYDTDMAETEGPDSLVKLRKQNLIEGIMFNEMTVSKDIPKITLEHLKYMMNWIRASNPALFKLKDPITGKGVTVSIHMVPQPPFIKQPDYMKGVTTAAATATGEIIFNIDFCNQLIEYAFRKDIKPAGGMYEANGGKIPNSFAYIEFLTLHELYHIVHADHFYQSQHKDMTPQLQNYLGDYITNYELVKKGYSQLPIGLFSETLNYDNYNSMKELQDAIVAAFKELPKDDQDDLQDKLNKAMDDHLDKDNEPNDGSGSGEGGEPSDSKGEGGEPSDSKGEGGEPSDGEGGEPNDSEGEGGKSGSGKSEGGKSGDSEGEDEGGESGDKNTDDKIDQAMKDSADDISKTAEERNKMTQEDVDKILEELDKESQSEQQDRLDDLAQKQAKRKKSMDDKKANKTYKVVPWDKLLKSMIPKKTVKEEESITKMANRTKSALAASLSSKDQMGVGVKAGVIKDEENEHSLLFILDNSGSMVDTIKNVNSQIIDVITKSARKGLKNAYVIKFDSDWWMYKINVDSKGQKHTYKQFKPFKDIKDVKQVIKKGDFKGTEKPISALFEEQWGGGTVFPLDVSKICLYLIKEQFNTVMFTDSDILDEDNVRIVKLIMIKAAKRPFSFNIIFDNKTSYSRAKAKFGSYKYMSHI